MLPTQNPQKREIRTIICHAHRKRDGKRCTRLALKGEEFCWQHSSSFRRKLGGLFVKVGGLAGILAITSLMLNVFKLRDTIFPTVTPTALPRASKLYFTFIIDASSRMSDTFDDGKTKWDSVREAALDNLILGLPARANYGLILLGGNQTGNTTSCEAIDMTLPLREDNRDEIGLLIEDQTPQGMSSLAKAIDLARNNLLALSDDSTVKALELWIFLGGGDGCLNNDLKPILFFVQESARFLTNTHMDLFILSNEGIDEDVLKAIEESGQAAGNVKVNVTMNNEELAAAVDQSYSEAKERARAVEPVAVAAQETIVVQNRATVEPVGINIPLNIAPTAGSVANTLAPIVTTNVTVSPLPTFTASITASLTFSSISPTPIPPTNAPPTQLPPTAIPLTTIPPSPIPPTSTPVPAVILYDVTYFDNGEEFGCNATIYFHVTGGPVTGSFRVKNAFYDTQDPPYDEYDPKTWEDGDHTESVGLGGHPEEYYLHEVWFVADNYSTDHMTGLICPRYANP